MNRSKCIDWPVVFKKLSNTMSIRQIALLTGFSHAYINKVINETTPVDPKHDKFTKAMLLFLSQTDYDIPVVGQYFDDVIDYEEDD